MKLEDAIAEVARKRALHKQGITDLTVGYWYDKKRLPQVRQTHRSWKEELSRFNRHIRNVIGNRPASAVTPQELLQLTENLKPARDGLTRLQDSTHNRIVALLSAIFTALQRQGYRPDNPAHVLRLRKERNQRGVFLRDADAPAFFAALKEAPDKLRLLILLMLFTGSRVTEALQCRWEWVDLPNALIRLPDSKSGRPRLIPLCDEAKAVCVELEQIRTGEFLFQGQKGKPMSRPGRAYKKLIEACGLKGLLLRDMRRTWATQANRAGVQMIDVSRALGHSSVQVTHRYIVSVDESLREAADKVGQHYARGSLPLELNTET